MLRTLHNSRQLSIESGHLGQVEKVELVASPISRRRVTAAPFTKKEIRTIVGRTKITVFIDNTDRDICQIFTIGNKSGTVRHQFQMMRLAGGMDRFFLYRFAGSIIGYNFQFAGS